MAIGKGSAASIYATVEDTQSAPERAASSTEHLSRGDGGLGLQLDVSPDAASTPTNVSTPIAVPRNTASLARGEGTSYIDAQPNGQSRPLLDRLDMESASNASAGPFGSGSPPMTPARKRLMELDSDAGGRSPGSRSVHIALTSPSTARTPLAATAPLPETPLKHGHDESTTATPTRSSIVERRRAPAMPPLSPPMQESAPDRAPRGLGLGLTPTKQSTSAYFGGALSPAISRGEARGPGTPSSRTKLLDFDMSSTTDEDESLSLTAQDIEPSSMLPAASSILTPDVGSSDVGSSSPSKPVSRNAKIANASPQAKSTADRGIAAKKKIGSATARGSGASRWADPEPQSPTLQHNDADQSGSAASLLSRMSLAPDSKESPSSPIVAAPTDLFDIQGSNRNANGKVTAPAKGQKLPHGPAAPSHLAPPPVADPLSPGATEVATPVLQTVDAFGGQSAKGLTSQVAAGRTAGDSSTMGVSSDSASVSSSTSAEPSTEGGTLSSKSTAEGSVDSSDPFVGESSACQPASSPMPHFDWADEEDDDDELPDLDGWGVTLAQSTSSPALPEPDATPQSVSTIASSTSAPILPADRSGESAHPQGPKQKKPAGWGKKGNPGTDAPTPASSIQSRLGGIKIAGIASSESSAPPTGPRGAGAPHKRELLPASGPSQGGSHASEPAGAKGPRGRGASGPGGGAWLHDMVQGPPPARRNERPKPQLSEGGAFARLAKGIVGVKGSGGPAPTERGPVVTPVSPPRNAPTGPAAGLAGKGAGGGGKGSKAKGQPSPRKPSNAKSPAKA